MSATLTFMPIVSQTPAFEPTADSHPPYDWPAWLVPGQTVTLKMGTDFSMEPRAFGRYVYARAAASTPALKVRVSYGYDDSVTFAVYRPGTPRPPIPGALPGNGLGISDPAPSPSRHRPAALPSCSLCSLPLDTRPGAEAGECRTSFDPAWRCTDGNPRPGARGGGPGQGA